jgi:hypothetical protein
MRKWLALSLIGIASTAEGQGLPSFTTSQLLVIDSVGDTTRTGGRLTDAKRLSDGRIIAAVCGTNELRAYDSGGKRLGSISLFEPGVQRSLVRLFPAGGDTVAAFEDLNSRITLVGPAFSIVRTIVPPNPDTATFNGRPRPSSLSVIGRLTDGTFIGRNPGRVSRDSGLHRRQLSLYRFNAAGALLDSLTIPGTEDRVIPGARTQQAMRLARTTVVAVSADRLVVGDQTAPWLVEYDAGLKVARRTPTVTAPLPVTDSIRAAWTRVAVAREMAPTNGVLAAFGDFYSDSMPAFRDLVAGTDRRIWAQDPHGADFYPLVWTAYQGGRAVARVELPPRFYPTQFGPDWLLGIATDSLPADRLQVLKLTPGPLTNARLSPKVAAPANRPRCGTWVSR